MDALDLFDRLFDSGQRLWVLLGGIGAMAVSVWQSIKSPRLRAGLLIGLLLLATAACLVGLAAYQARQQKDAQQGGQAEQKETRPQVPRASAPTRPVVSLLAATRVMRDHLEMARVDTRTFRFLTLTHLHNDSTVIGADLKACHRAIKEAWGNAAEAVDENRCVYAIDLAAMQTRELNWARLTIGYPYGVNHACSADPELAGLSGDLERLTGDAIPVLRADWALARSCPQHARDDSPVHRLAHRAVGLSTLTAELGLVGPGAFQAHREKLARVPALSGVLADKAPLARADWEAPGEGGSLFQTTAALVGLGGPKLCEEIKPIGR